MQGKSFVRFFTIALLLVVAYIFILMIPTNNVERAADRHAAARVASIPQDSIEKKNLDPLELEDIARQEFLDSVSDEQVFSLGFKGYTYQELKRQQLALGLDLKGGMSVVLQVDLKELIDTLAKGGNKDPVFRKALKNATDAQASAQTDFVTLFANSYKSLTDKPLGRFFVRSNKLKDIDINSSDADVVAAIREEASATVERTFNLLKQRIDKFGGKKP